jgi:hypothetical protein
LGNHSAPALAGEESQIVSGSRALPLAEIARDVSLRSISQAVCIYEMTSKENAHGKSCLFADCGADISDLFRDSNFGFRISLS